MSAPEPRRSRLAVLKTYKLFIGGKFPRTESGRYTAAQSPKSGEHLANYCHASRKDFRDAVVAARRAQPAWAASSAYLRGQILYRIAEMVESRADSLTIELQASTGTDRNSARVEIEASIDRLIYYAGWADKFQQVLGSVNPVSSPHFSFSTPEPTGVVGIFCPDSPALLSLVSLMAPAIVGGNSCIILASEKFPLPAISFAEVIATSDVPGGIVNLLTGRRSELAPHFASHMDVNAIVEGSGDADTTRICREGCAANLKRTFTRTVPEPAEWFGADAQDPYQILDTSELKTTWHPIGF
jgi:acyl-CoA reductase-like NAD-dependent aldehyde dehydrogenase